MSVIPDGFAEVVSEFNVPGLAGPALVVFGVDSSSAADATTVADIVWNDWTQASGVLSNLSNGVALIRTRVNMNDGGTLFYGEHTGSIAGGAAGNALPINCAYLASKRTGRVGREFQGRMYLPGATEAEVGPDGIVTPTFIATMQTDLTDFLGDLTTNLIPMVLLHNDALVAPTVVSSINMTQKIGTQRRRMR